MTYGRVFFDDANKRTVCFSCILPASSTNLKSDKNKGAQSLLRDTPIGRTRGAGRPCFVRRSMVTVRNLLQFHVKSSLRLQEGLVTAAVPLEGDGTEG